MDANTLVFFWGKKTRFSIRVDFSELYTIRKKHIFPEISPSMDYQKGYLK